MITLSIGTRLGPYEILEFLGAGGMGQVYRARDPRLGRDVAVKVSAERFSERFEREARMIAALNHPNICTLYDVGPNYLVMEYIEGTTPRGPLAVDEALRIGRQVADALEAAHERGIVHRDLKPGNILIRSDGTVKVLDFGIAKVVTAAAAGSEKSPTITMGATQAGNILGTAAYMSPEQARGQDVDSRADIWSFGVLLCELVSGRPVFAGPTVSDTLASVLKAEPNLTAIPPVLRSSLERCLRKDPRLRWRCIGDARIALEEGLHVGPAPPVERGRAVNTMGDYVCGAGRRLRRGLAGRMARDPLGGSSPYPRQRGSRSRRRHGPQCHGRHFTRRAQAGLLNERYGRHAAACHPPPRSTPTCIAARYRKRQGSILLSRWPMDRFLRGRAAQKDVRSGRGPVILGSFSGLTQGATWSEDGSIIAATGVFLPLSRIPAGGGVAQPLTRLGPGEITHRWPQVVSGANAVLFTASSSASSQENANIEAVSLRTGAVKVVQRGGYYGRYMPGGLLVYISQGTLFGVKFDPKNLQTVGTPIPIVEDVAANPATGGGQFDFSANGTFVYAEGKAAAQRWRISWLDASGAIKPLSVGPGAYSGPRISPDGRKLTFVEKAEVYVHDLERDTTSRVNFNGSGLPIWAPDGKHLIIKSDASTLAWVRSDSAKEPQKLLDNSNRNRSVYPWSVSSNGKWLAYTEISPDKGFDIWTVPLDVNDPDHPKAGKPELFLSSAADANIPQFSPDGRWIAYRSTESGIPEIYVRPFPAGSGGMWQVSSGGAYYPLWSTTSHQLFFENTENRIMVLDYTVEAGSFVPGKPRPWSSHQLFYAGTSNLDLAPDGKRFVVFSLPENPLDTKRSVHVTMLFNFFDEVRRRIP